MTLSELKMLEDSALLFDLLAWLVIVVLFSAYTKNMQETTLRMGRMLFQTEELRGTGVQDAITPKWQTRNIIIMYVALIVYAGVCVYVLVWYLGILLFLFTFFILIPVVAKTLMPRPLSYHFIDKIQKDLERRHHDYQASGNGVRAEAVNELRHRISGVSK